VAAKLYISTKTSFRIRTLAAVHAGTTKTLAGDNDYDHLRILAPDAVDTHADDVADSACREEEAHEN
jgi:hypothetical protein